MHVLIFGWLERYALASLSSCVYLLRAFVDVELVCKYFHNNAVTSRILRARSNNNNRYGETASDKYEDTRHYGAFNLSFHYEVRITKRQVVAVIVVT